MESALKSHFVIESDPALPFKEVYYPDRKKRDDAEIGNTSIWPVVERAKKAGVPSIQDWRRNKTVASAADELRYYNSVNAIIDKLSDLIRDRKRT